MGSITTCEIEAGRRYRVRWRTDERKGFHIRAEAELYLTHASVIRTHDSYAGAGEERRVSIEQLREFLDSRGLHG